MKGNRIFLSAYYVNSFEVTWKKFDVNRAVHRNNISIAKPTGCTNVNKKKVNQSRYRPGVAQRVPGS